jgi:glycerate 2-kinase
VESINNESNTDKRGKYSKISIIKNNENLIKNHNYTSVIDSLNALEFAFYSTRPDKIIKKNICFNSQLTIKDLYGHYQSFSLDNKNKIFVISVGKASVLMLNGLLEILKEKIKNIILILPKGQTFDHDYFENISLNKEKIIIVQSSHPIPDNDSLNASEQVIRLLKQVTNYDMVIFLISGGTSSLLVSPSNHLTIHDKKTLNHFLLMCGANIREINIVRKHLSKVKGGNILKYIDNKCCVIGLILSDVIGDNLDTIGSGLTSFDDSTFFDAKCVLEKYSLFNMNNKSMKKIKETINLGIVSKLPETLKFKEFVERDVHNFIIGNNHEFCNFLIHYLSKLNYDIKYFVSNYDKQLFDFITDCKYLIENYLVENSCILIGGEITSTINNKKIGKGGRAQESLCYLIDFFCNNHYKDYSIIFIGTDGIDGNSKAAGGIITPKTIEFLKRKQIDIQKYIISHDSYNLLSQLHSNIFTGYTGTNFNDVYLFVRK